MRWSLWCWQYDLYCLLLACLNNFGVFLKKSYSRVKKREKKENNNNNNSKIAKLYILNLSFLKISTFSYDQDLCGLSIVLLNLYQLRLPKTQTIFAFGTCFVLPFLIYIFLPFCPVLCKYCLELSSSSVSIQSRIQLSQYTSVKK